MTHHAGQRGLLLDAPGWERSSALAFRCSAPHATCDPAPLLRGPPSSVGPPPRPPVSSSLASSGTTLS